MKMNDPHLSFVFSPTRKIYETEATEPPDDQDLSLKTEPAYIVRYLQRKVMESKKDQTAGRT